MVFTNDVPPPNRSPKSKSSPHSQKDNNDMHIYMVEDERGRERRET
jgi:hypothetical protein